MISLLNLGGLYNTHVRPYAANQDDGQGSDDEGGQAGNKRRRIKIEKGYQHLLPDCIGLSNSLPRRAKADIRPCSGGR